MMQLSKNKIKYIHSLDLKKIRKEEKVFLAEGPKLVGDLLGRFPCRLLVATPEWMAANRALIGASANGSGPRAGITHKETAGNTDATLLFTPTAEIIEVGPEELSKASLLKTPQQVLAVFEQPDYPVDFSVLAHSLCLALDDVQDPGNLGTIIRLADWFGIEHLFCSTNTVDAYNPKTIQATMGGIARVKVHYTSLPDLIRAAGDVPVYGTFLDGENMYEQPLSAHGLIVMGNEGKGIGAEVEMLINRKLYIPNYPQSRETSESLNVAIATAVVCAEFRRQAASK